MPKPPLMPAGMVVGRRGPTGPAGANGLDGVNAVPADTAVGTYVDTDGTNSANSVDARIKRALPFITPKMFAAVGDGTTDDSAAIIAMYAAAKTAGGANCIMPDRYAVRGRIIQPGGVHVFGGGVRRVLATDDHKDRGLVALDNTFVYQYGAWGSGSIDDNPGKIDGLNIDGAGVGGATHLFEMQCVDGAIVDCRIVNSAGDAVELGGSQNSTFERCVIGYSAGAAWSCNQTGGQGAGQVKVNNSYLSDSAVLVKPTGDPAQFPSHDIFYTQCLFENHQIGDNIGSLLAGDMRFTRCTFTNSNSGTVPQDALIKVSQDVYPVYSTTVEFNSCYWNGGANADKPAAAVWVKAASGGVGNIVVFTGHHQVTNVDAALAVEGTTIANDIRDKASWYLGSGVQMYSTAPGGSLFGVLEKRRSPVVYSMPDDASGTLRNPLAVRRDTDTGQINRLEIDRDGGSYWRDGAVSTVRASLAYSTSLSVLAMGGTWQATNAWVLRQANVFVSTAGQAVTITAGAAGAPATAVNFSVNSATAALTVANPSISGQQLQVVFNATTTTGNTVTWPSNVHFTGTAPQPVDGKIVIVNLVGVGTTDWYEVSRSSGSGSSGITSVNGYTTPSVTLAAADVGAVPTSRQLAGLDLTADRTAAALKTALAIAVADVSGAAPLANPALTGNPTAPTQTAGDNSTKLANTAFVTAAIAAGGGTVVHIGTTATAAATAAKTATISSYTPAAGDRLDLTLTNGNIVGAPTLNINGAGAVGIYIGGAVADVAQVFSGANVIWSLKYDGTRWNLIGAQSNFTTGTAAEMQAGTATSIRWLNAALVFEAQTVINLVTLTANTTLDATHRAKVVQGNVTSPTTIAFTLPTNATTPIAVGTWLEFRQIGSGPLSVSGASGVTCHPSTATARSQYSTFRAQKIATDEWVFDGDFV